MNKKPWHCDYCVVYSRGFGALPLVRRLLVVCIAQLRSELSSRPVHVGFLADRVTLGKYFSPTISFKFSCQYNFPANTIFLPIQFSCQYNFPSAAFSVIRHRHHINLAVYGVVKLHTRTFHSVSHFLTSYIYFSWVRLCWMTVRVRREVSLRHSICTAQSVSAHGSADKRQRT